MSRRIGMLMALAIFLANGTASYAGDHGLHGTPPPAHFLHRLGPAGGWNPDGRGIFHWWDRDCLLPPCGPDDYCRKPLPRTRCTPRPIGPVAPIGHSRR